MRKAVCVLALYAGLAQGGDVTLGSANAWAISPDGSRMAYVSCPVRSLGIDGCEISISSPGGKEKPVSIGGHQAAWMPSWSPDGRLLAYYAIDNRIGGVWVFDVTTGRQRALWQAPDPEQNPIARGTLPSWSDDGSALAFAHAAARPPAPPANTKVSVIVQHSYPRDNAPGWAGGAVAERIPSFIAVRLELPTGREQRLAGIPTSLIQFSNDGRRVAYLDRTEEPAAAMRRARYSVAHNLVVGDLLTGEKRVIARGVLQYINLAGALSWSPDDRWIAFSSGDRFIVPPTINYDVVGDLFFVASDGSVPAAKVEDFPPEGVGVSRAALLLWSGDSTRLVVRSGDRKIWTVDARTRRVTKLDMGPLAYAASVAVDSQRRGLYTSRGSIFIFGATDGSHDGYVHLAPLSGEPGRQLYRAPVYFPHNPSLSAPQVNARSGRIYFDQESSSLSRNVWSADLRLRAPRRETAIDEQLPVGLKSGVIAYQDPGGRTLQLAILYPAGYDATRRYPAIMWVYPNGPGSLVINNHHFGNALGFELEQLALRGYVVAVPDMPVTLGQFSEHLDIAAQAAADALAARGIADPKHIGLMGSSGGGFATLSLLSSSQRWRVGVMCNGYGDKADLWGHMIVDDSSSWAHFLPLTDFQQGGSPWEIPDGYLRNSPLYWLNKVKAPILIQTGMRDEPFNTSSSAVYAGLIRAGHTQVTHVVYTNEGHYIADAENHRDFWERVIAFLDGNL